MKKIILILTILLLSGCSLDYELNINDDLSLNETIKIVEIKSTMLMYIEDIDEYIKENIQFFGSKPENSIFNIYDASDNTKAIGVATVNYKSFDDYCKTNIAKDYFFSNCKITTDENIVTINLKSNASNEVFEQGYVNGPLFKEAYLKLIVPYKVTYSNADSIDLEKGIYSWKYTVENHEKDISIMLDTSHIYEAPLNYSLYIIGGIILVVAISGIYIYYKYRQNSKF